MKNTYRFADLDISISAIYKDVERLCADYRIPARHVAFSVETSRADIEFERDKSVLEQGNAEEARGTFSDGYLETLAIYRKIAETIPFYGVILFHGSCVAVDGAGYLFTGPSGSGKSTHTSLWRRMLGDRATMVNDDKPLIHVGNTAAMIYGTPWDGKHRLSANISVPLKAVCFLKKAKENSIKHISAVEAYTPLLQQAYRPYDIRALDKTLNLIDRLASSVSLWEMRCNKQLDAALLAYTAMRGSEE